MMGFVWMLLGMRLVIIGLVGSELLVEDAGSLIPLRRAGDPGLLEIERRGVVGPEKEEPVTWPQC